MKRITTVAIGSFLVVSSGAWAAQSAPSGQYVFICEMKPMKLDEGHSFFLGHWKGLTG